MPLLASTPLLSCPPHVEDVVPTAVRRDRPSAFDELYGKSCDREVKESVLQNSSLSASPCQTVNSDRARKMERYFATSRKDSKVKVILRKRGPTTKKRNLWGKNGMNRGGKGGTKRRAAKGGCGGEERNSEIKIIVGGCVNDKESFHEGNVELAEPAPSTSNDRTSRAVCGGDSEEKTGTHRTTSDVGPNNCKITVRKAEKRRQNSHGCARSGCSEGLQVHGPATTSAPKMSAAVQPAATGTLRKTSTASITPSSDPKVMASTDSAGRRKMNYKREVGNKCVASKLSM